MGWRFMAALPLMAAASWVICTGLIGKKEYENVKLEEDCVRYIERALPKILRNWSYAEWKSRASSELLLSVNHKRFQRDFKENRQVFGYLRQIRTPVGRVEVDTRGGVSETIGYYTSPVRFEMGSADIAMRLVKRAGGWKFQQFSVRSDLTPLAD